MRRTALLVALGGYIDRHGHDRARLLALLGLDERELIRALGAAELAKRLELGAPPAADGARRQRRCRHAAEYPDRLRLLAGAPAVLHLAGEKGRLAELLAAPTVAVVGSRRCTAYGRDVARWFGRGLSAAGVTVVSGMAFGIDAAAHEGALAAGGRTIAVLPGGADAAYPANHRVLHRRILEHGGTASELPWGTRPRTWCFLARNRTIAALADVTVVVEASERSGSLVTAAVAQDLGREVAAIPGLITSPAASGSNRLLADGAQLLTDVRELLELLYGMGAQMAPASERAALEPQLARVRDAIASGIDSIDALVSDGLSVEEATTAAVELELAGLVRVDLAGRYVALPR